VDAAADTVEAMVDTVAGPLQDTAEEDVPARLEVPQSGAVLAAALRDLGRRRIRRHRVADVATGNLLSERRFRERA
jgi:hypothetical protein